MTPKLNISLSDFRLNVASMLLLSVYFVATFRQNFGKLLPVSCLHAVNMEEK